MNEIRREFGLDKSLAEQLFIYGKKLLTGDFGFSYFQGKPVLELILEKIWATALLVLTAMFMAVTIGVFTGVMVAYNALAHKLSRAVYYLLRENVPFAEAKLFA